MVPGEKWLDVISHSSHGYFASDSEINIQGANRIGKIREHFVDFAQSAEIHIVIRDNQLILSDIVCDPY